MTCNVHVMHVLFLCVCIWTPNNKGMAVHIGIMMMHLDEILYSQCSKRTG